MYTAFSPGTKNLFLVLSAACCIVAFFLMDAMRKEQKRRKWVCVGIEWAVENHGTTIIELSDEEQQKFVDILNESKASIAASFDEQGLPGTELVDAIVEHSAEYE